MNEQLVNHLLLKLDVILKYEPYKQVFIALCKNVRTDFIDMIEIFNMVIIDEFRLHREDIILGKNMYMRFCSETNLDKSVIALLTMYGCYYRSKYNVMLEQELINAKNVNLELNMLIPAHVNGILNSIPR